MSLMKYLMLRIQNIALKDIAYKYIDKNNKKVKERKII